MRTPRNTIGPGDGPRRKHPLLVENAIVGQIDLETHRFDTAAVEQRQSVVELALLDPGQADERGRAAIGGVARQVLASRTASLLKRRLQHQVLRRIAGQEKFG